MSKNKTAWVIVGVFLLLITATISFSKTPTSSTAINNKVENQKNASPTGAKPSNIIRTALKPLGAPTATQGSVVLAIKDAPASLEGIDSVIMTVSSVKIHSVGGAWMTLSNTPTQFDLMELKNDELPTLLARANLEKGSFDAIEIFVSNISVIKDGIPQEAKIPSGRLLFTNLKITLGAKQTATVAFDFLADKSFHITGNGKYIFTPIIKVEAKRDVRAQVKDDHRLDISGGVTTFSDNVGMDENGELKSKFEFSGYSSLDIVGNSIHVINKEETDGKAKIAGTTAITGAINSGFIDSVISFKIETREGVLVWKIIGAKNLIPVKIYVNATTGVIVGRE